MKKLSVLLLSAVLMMCAVSCAMAAGDAAEYEFRPKTVNAVGLSRSEWIASSDSRAMLTLLMGFDLENLKIGFDSGWILEGMVYVASNHKTARDSIVISISKDDTYMIIYNTRTGEANCNYVPGCDGALMKYTYEQANMPYYRAQSEHLREVAANFETVLRRLMQN